MINSKRQERIQKIMRVIEDQGNASTIFLAKSLNVSESSIRRDIGYLVSSGKFGNVKRVYGGVVLDNDSEGHELMFELKLALNRELKTAIAKRASEFIADGDHIMIDSGTTCLCLAERLFEKEGLCVITLDIKIAEELGKHSNIESNIIGGVVRPGYYTVGGIRALDNLERFSASKVFMSVDAIDIEHGITNSSEFEVGVKQRLIQMAKHVYILADSTKIGTHTLYRVAPFTSVHTIITDRHLDEDKAQAIRSKNIELILV
jgi:DeoR/GlpR family transcriptional regulator of sugar metabolism